MIQTDTLDQAAILGMQEKHGLTYLPVPDSFSALTKELDDIWKDFCAQPMSHKRLLVFEDGMGHEYRDETNPDYKETLHVQLIYELPAGYSAIDKLFVECSKAVIRDSMPIVSDYASVLNDIAQFDIRSMIMEDVNRWVNRSIRYFPRTLRQVESGNNVPGERHVDKGLTFGWRESADGLMVYWNKQWVPLRYVHGHVHSYAGLLGQYYTKCALKALCHEIVANSFTEVAGRTSHVMFVDFGGVRYNKGKYGRTQSMFPCGENYDMPFEVFKEYFIPVEDAKVY